MAKTVVLRYKTKFHCRTDGSDRLHLPAICGFALFFFSSYFQFIVELHKETLPVWCYTVGNKRQSKLTSTVAICHGQTAVVSGIEE